MNTREFTEPRHPGEAILSEANFHRSREVVTIAQGQTIAPGTVLARLAVVDGVVARAAPGAGNAGNGVLTLGDPAVSSRVKDGVYTVTCTEASANGGTFDVADPDGKSIGAAKVGVAFNKAVKFTIADGATDFAAGDRFTITVQADIEGYRHVAYDQDGADGSEVPDVIAIYGAATGEGETTNIAVIARDAEVNDHCIVWPAEITPAEKADAVQALEGKGIIVRS